MYTHVYIYVCIYICIVTNWASCTTKRPSSRCVRVYGCAGECMCECAHTYTFTYIYIYIYIHMYLHTVIYIYMYIYASSQTELFTRGGAGHPDHYVCLCEEEGGEGALRCE